MARNDFNGDGRSDILWLLDQNAAVSNWLATAEGSFTINDANAFTWLTAFHTLDLRATGDFNGDGRTDVLWQVDQGAFHNVWFASPDGGLDLTGVPSSGFTMGDPNWAIAGTGDFNGNGVDDLLWRNADGTLSNWLGSQNGAFVVNDTNALVHVPNGWQIVTTADFNGDGRADILWRNDEGTISNWLGTEAGGFLINDANALTESFSQTIAGVGDFNGDGCDDLLWQVADGQLYASLTFGNGTMYAHDWNTGFVANIVPEMVVATIGDFDADGDDDILWRGPNDALTRWLSEGDGYHYQSTSFGNVPIAWQTGDYLLA